MDKHVEELKKIQDYTSAIEYIRCKDIRIKKKVELLELNSEHLKELKKIKKIPDNKIVDLPFNGMKNVEKKLSNPLLKWVESVKNNLGHEVASFFNYSIWLISKTLLSYILSIFSFICIPYIIYLSKNGKYFRSTENLQGSYCFQNLSRPLKLLDLLAADNGYINLGLFGCFPGNFDEKYELNYNMQYAYLLSLIVFFLYWLITIGSELVQIVTESYINTTQILSLSIISRRIFVSWPYYSREEKYLNKKHTQIKNQTVADLKVCESPSKQKKYRFLIYLFTNLIFFGALGYLTYFIYDILESDYLDEFALSINEIRLIFAACVSTLNYLSPLICKILSLIEISLLKCFNREPTKNVDLIRMLLMQLVMFGLTISFILINRAQCWENEIAKQILVIFIFDFIMEILDHFIMLFYKFICSCVYPRHEITFNLSYYTINTLFSQILFWFGVYFSPVLGVLHLIKLLIVFFIRSVFVKIIYRPPEKVSSSATTGSNVIITTLIAFIIGIFGLAGISFGVETSKTCGPFNDLEYPKVYDYLLKLKSDLTSINIIGLIFKLVLSPGMIAFFIFLLSVLIYTSCTILNGHKKTVRLLKLQLEKKKRDRKHLNKVKKDFLDKLNGRDQVNSRNSEQSINTPRTNFGTVRTTNDNKPQRIEINQMKEKIMVFSMPNRSNDCVSLELDHRFVVSSSQQNKQRSKESKPDFEVIKMKDIKKSIVRRSLESLDDDNEEITF